MMTIIALLATLYIVAPLAVIRRLCTERGKYRTAWKRELETTNRIRKERAQIGIENVGLRAEIMRLKAGKPTRDPLIVRHYFKGPGKVRGVRTVPRSQHTRLTK